MQNLSYRFLGCAAAGLLALAQAGFAADGDDKTKQVQAGSLKITVPESWKQGPPGRPFRQAEFEIPAVEGDKEPGEYVVFHFGAGGGGGVQANIDRWIGQFRSDGRKVKVFKGTSTSGKYTLIDLTGTYNKPIGPPIQGKTQPMPGARMLGVVLQSEKDGDYFLKFTGPEKTVTAAADTFRASFGGDAKKEKEVKPDAEKKAAE
jgi:gluconolactonase